MEKTLFLPYYIFFLTFTFYKKNKINTFILNCEFYYCSTFVLPYYNKNCNIYILFLIFVFYKITIILNFLENNVIMYKINKNHHYFQLWFSLLWYIFTALQ